MRSVLFLTVLLAVGTQAAFGMTYEQYIKSTDNDIIDSMMSTLEKFSEKTSMQPGTTFVIKNDMGKPQKIITDFIGDTILDPGRTYVHVFKEEGTYHYRLPNGNGTFTIEVAYPDWYHKVDAKTKQEITDKMIEKAKLEAEMSTLEEKTKENGRKQNELVQRAIAAGGWTDELRAEGDALAEEFNTLSEKPQTNRIAIKNIEKNLLTLTNPELAPPKPDINLDEIRNSEQTASWVKTLFTWHDQKLISTDDLVTTVKYLIENNILA